MNKETIKTILIAILFVGSISIIYIFGYFEGKDSVVKGIQLESIDNGIRFIFNQNDSGIWKAVYRGDGTFIGFAIYNTDNSFKTFVHINETIKAKLC